MSKSVLLLLLLLAGTTACQKLTVEKPDPGTDVSYSNHPKHGRYQAALDKYRKQYGAPGGILLIKRANEPLWIGASGQANLAHQTAMRTNHQFRTGSVTKMLTAVVILQLVQEGKLSLDDKLDRVVPDLNRHISDAASISIRHMLSHLSGIYDPPNDDLGYQSDILNNPERMARMTVEEKLRKYVAGRKLKFRPGTGYAYSNTNYWLLGAIAEEKTGKNLSTLFRERIFTPLAMNHSYLEVKNDRNVVRGYADLYGNGQLMDVTLWDRAEGDGEADGGLVSTAEDLYRFMNGLFGGQLVSAALLTEMKRIQLPTCNTPDCEYGLGLEIWNTQAGTAYGHNGGLIGIEANVLFYPDKNAVMVLYKNNGNNSLKEFVDQLVAE